MKNKKSKFHSIIKESGPALGAAEPPIYVTDDSIVYECITGSYAYGCHDDSSDFDIYGVCCPPIEAVIPTVNGYVPGFGPAPLTFNQFTTHNIQDANGQTWDFTIYNIVKYLSLVADNNPNMIDTLFVPENCVTKSTPISDYLREHRSDFLHKGAWHRFRGYAYSQLNKCRSKTPEHLQEIKKFEKSFDIPHTTTLNDVQKAIDYFNGSTDGYIIPQAFVKMDKQDVLEYASIFEKGVAGSKRLERIKTDGFDRKFAYHIVQLTLECEQILESKHIDLQRDKNLYKAIREGDQWSFENIEKWFKDKEKQLDKLYEKCSLPYSPDWDLLQKHLNHCLEIYYGEDFRTNNIPSSDLPKQIETLKGVKREIHQLVTKAGLI